MHGGRATPPSIRPKSGGSALLRVWSKGAELPHQLCCRYMSGVTVCTLAAVVVMKCRSPASGGGGRTSTAVLKSSPGTTPGMRRDPSGEWATAIEGVMCKPLAVGPLGRWAWSLMHFLLFRCTRLQSNKDLEGAVALFPCQASGRSALNQMGYSASHRQIDRIRDQLSSLNPPSS